MVSGGEMQSQAEDYLSYSDYIDSILPKDDDARIGNRLSREFGRKYCK